MDERAKFIVAEVVEITGRGLAILGKIQERSVCPGMVINGGSSGQSLPDAMITAVEGVRCMDRPDFDVGLIVRFQNEADRQLWKNMKRTELTAEIVESTEKLEDFKIC